MTRFLYLELAQTNITQNIVTAAGYKKSIFRKTYLKKKINKMLTEIIRNIENVRTPKELVLGNRKYENWKIFKK